jgi:hypothetical protein
MAARQAQREARFAAKDDARCQSFGFTHGTDAYANCRMKLWADRNAAQQAAIAAAAQSASDLSKQVQADAAERQHETDEAVRYMACASNSQCTQ